jgi:hypothetical protein
MKTLHKILLTSIALAGMSHISFGAAISTMELLEQYSKDELSSLIHSVAQGFNASEVANPVMAAQVNGITTSQLGSQTAPTETAVAETTTGIMGLVGSVEDIKNSVQDAVGTTESTIDNEDFKHAIAVLSHFFASVPQVIGDRPTGQSEIAYATTTLCKIFALAKQQGVFAEIPVFFSGIAHVVEAWVHDLSNIKTDAGNIKADIVAGEEKVKKGCAPCCILA